ncbi:putative dioxygenase [Aspergillus nomiae NRRL 13137]|uniref:Putative dioxygenase n=1 Tax=Aspergillus nomiae NRRL (strain ATCC 15546 / NRRL 13137 / CBS 260.88 / M93) TaxID=1509407 RepID=A0A0L1ILT4_ASPN3|nr:putative dioxygenase [Aspergillus nomiae NRRL 13137]KNG80519.1 putative dioxygenase [Aspergillus nomiae NRRL 13137]
MTIATGITESQVHFNNWPNDRGFEANYEERTPVELTVTGCIPSYAAGVLYRTGPGKYKVDRENGETFQVSHWFDGFSETHRFQLVAPDTTHSSLKVFYNSRFSTDFLIEEARKTGRLGKISFGQKRDPCKTVYQKAQSEFNPDPSSANVGVTLSVNMPGLDKAMKESDQSSGRWTNSSGIETLYAKTDSASYKKIDPDTLEPVGLASQKDLHPDLDGLMSASHARSDPITGDVYNFNLAFGKSSTYRVFHDYVILCVWNSHINPTMLEKGSFLQAIQSFDASQPTKWYVVDRTQGQGLVATYESPPFFCFHTINAWQEPSASGSGVDIVAELVRFDTTDTLHTLYYEKLVSSSAEAKAHAQLKKDTSRSEFARFRLSDIPASPSTEVKTAAAEWTSCKAFSPELPTMNPKLVTQKHRYSYAITDRGESTFFDGIIKFDSQTKETLLWHHHAQSPGEPIFVPRPDGLEEDDGVLLSVVLDGYSGKSYLLCLDAHTLKELGRAHVNGPVGFGFHGQHIPLNGVPTGDY